jgi:hypothetical protein
MKPLFLFAGILLFNFFSIAQSNNPYNQTGVDLINHIITVEDDIAEGRVSGLSCEVVDDYSRDFGLVNENNCTNAQNVYSTLSNPAFDHEAYINASTLSSAAKSILITLCNQSETLTDAAFSDYIVQKVNDINSSDLSGKEKEIALKACALGYNAINNPNYAGRECSGCQFIGGVIGIIGGSILCGPICGIVGGLVGWVVGGIFGGNK